MQFEFNTFKNYINPNRNQSWQPVAKIGLGFILIGLILIIMKEIIIAILKWAGLIGGSIFGVHLINKGTEDEDWFEESK